MVQGCFIISARLHDTGLRKRTTENKILESGRINDPFISSFALLFILWDFFLLSLCMMFSKTKLTILSTFFHSDESGCRGDLEETLGRGE